MRLLIVLITLLLVTFSSFSQNIIAGQFDANEYYFDFNPDYVLAAPGTSSDSTDSLSIDLNNDGTNDIRLAVINQNGGNWYNKKYTEIIPLNNNQIVLGKIDTCFANCAPPDYVSFEAITQAYDSLALIDYSANWIDSSSHLAFFKQESNIPNACGYACSGGLFDASFKYLGVRVLTGSDTLYRWVKLKFEVLNSIDYTLTVESFACNQYQTSGLMELEKANKKLVQIVDLLGREVYDESNNVLIYIYSDGTTEKVVRIE